MYNHNKAQQSKNRVHISWDILYVQFPTLWQSLSSLSHNCNCSWTVSITWYDIGGLVQERHNSIANALELRFSCNNPSICELRSYRQVYIKDSLSKNSVLLPDTHVHNKEETQHTYKMQLNSLTFSYDYIIDSRGDHVKEGFWQLHKTQ